MKVKLSRRDRNITKLIGVANITACEEVDGALVINTSDGQTTSVPDGKLSDVEDILSAFKIKVLTLGETNDSPAKQPPASGPTLPPIPPKPTGTGN